MRIFTNRDIKVFFQQLSWVLAGFILLLQLVLRFCYGHWNPGVFFLSLGAAACLLFLCFLYFRKQDQVLEKAMKKITLYLGGDREVRLDCDQEGSLCKLFHGVNTLATTLEAHGAKEERAKEFLKDTMSDISHQLKTPLAALELYHALLQEEREDPVAVQQFLLKSEKETERIEVLVQKLLKITKLDAGAIPMVKGWENLSRMMKLICSHFEIRGELEQKHMLLLGAEDVELFCDRDWLMEAVANVVKNAFDHTERGSTIEIRWDRLPAITQITVKDEGQGIHPEDIHHIFKRFYRSRFSKDTQGIGLGLPLARIILEAHGGIITVDSVPGQGSTFVMSFPSLTKL